jgi:hypothetical protein
MMNTKNADKQSTVGKRLLVYKVILSIIAIFTFGVVLYVVSQAGVNKADSQTYNRANDIATSLQNFTDNNGYAPGSLSAAGIKNVPSSVTYNKLSESSYRFCVDYKAASSDFSATTVESDIITQSGSSNSDDQNYGSQGFLFVNPTHPKGNNCQTVTISSYSDYNNSSGSYTGSDTGSYTGSYSSSPDVLYQ